MRICFIAHSNSPWMPHYGRFLKHGGHEVHVISFHPQPIEGVSLHYVGPKAGTGELPKWLYLTRIAQIRSLLKVIQPDVLVATYLRSNGLLGSLLGFRPLVLSARGADYSFPLPFGLSRQLLRWMTRQADAVMASSNEIAEDLVLEGVPRASIGVIPMGTMPQVFTPRTEMANHTVPRLLCLRKFFPLYDNATLLRSLARLNREGFSFQARFLGDGPLRAACMSLSKEMRIDSQIEFLGECDHREIPAQLRWADILLSATKTDGAPSSLFEAMSCQVFPVVSDIAANRAWVRHGESGLLFGVGDDATCAACIRRAWEDVNLRQRAGEINRQTVLTQLDQTRMLERFEALLVTVVSRPGIHAG
jgi:glycosyltransferase involved in cell wall biosynthesis